MSPTATRRRAAGALVVLIVAAVAALVALSLVVRDRGGSPTMPTAVGELLGADRGPATEADGVLPPGATAADDRPGITGLDADLLDALRAATADAAAAGIEVRVTSGWRSAAYQDQLLRDAVSTYGSEEEAARWVATSTTSAHVAGQAVDVGSWDAIGWLAEHGAGYGLCQTYGNESWHFELRPEAVASGCPPPYRDPTQDPRLQG